MARVNFDDEDDSDDTAEDDSGGKPIYSRAQVAKECQKSVFWVRSQETLGKLEPKKDERGHFKFTQEDLYTALELANIEPSDSSNLVRAGTDFTKVTVKHLESILKLAHEPATAVMLMLQEENSRVRKQFQELWDKYIELLGKFEDMQQANAEREIIKEQAMSAERRKDKALDAIMLNGPAIVNNLINKDKGMNDLVQLLKSMSDEQLTALADAELINLSQLETIKKIRGTLV